jgi:iron(III) transport system ATP-binding protein
MLEVNNVSLGYGATTVVRAVQLHLAKGEIGCLLGPSGCGKTTLLRAIAGFEPVRAGEIALKDQVVARAGHGLAPQHRDIGMVFQDHALFPHLDVAGNIGFGLHRVPAAERAARVRDMLALVGLQGMGARWPHELSGGQQQRVALARALAPQPSLLLMDEPFSSLDTSLRESIAREVRHILKQAGATALMVTHDQNEAFTMADVIGVMAGGVLQQWGTALQVYCQPATRAVATFVGEGALLPARRAPDGRWRLCLEERVFSALAPLPADHPCYAPVGGASSPELAQILLRPEHLALFPGAAASPQHETVEAVVRARHFRGSHFVYSVELPGGHLAQANAPLSLVCEVGERVRCAVVSAA